MQSPVRRVAALIPGAHWIKRHLLGAGAAPAPVPARQPCERGAPPRVAMAEEPGDDVKRLRQYLDRLSSYSDDDLARYELLRPPMPPGWYWRLRWFASSILRWLESMHLRRPDPWPVDLRQQARGARARPLLLWAVGADRETLRTACRTLAAMRAELSGFAPVLVTDVTDFAFFSRLGWLVEYLPAVSGDGEPYDERKARFLSRLYRDAPALPIGVALNGESREDILRWVVS